MIGLVLFFQCVIGIPFIGGVLFMIPIYIKLYDSIPKAIGMGIGASIFGYLWTLWFFIPFWLIVWLLFYLRAVRGILISQRWVFPIICSSCFWGIYKHFSSTLFKTHNEWFVGVVSVVGGLLYGLYLSKLELRDWEKTSHG